MEKYLNIWLILFVALIICTPLPVLFKFLNETNSISHSLLDLIRLLFKLWHQEIFPFWKLIDIGNIIFLRNQQFCRILEQHLIILIIEPKYINFSIFLMFNHIEIHGCFCCFFESKLLPINTLLIGNCVLLVLFPIFKLFLIVNNNLHFFCEVFRGSMNLVGLWRTRISEAWAIFYSSEVVVGD